MQEPELERLKRALILADEQGNVEDATKLSKLIRERQNASAPSATEKAPERPFWHRVADNVIGLDDGYQSDGEKLGELLNKGGQGLMFGFGDEAHAAAESLINDKSYGENLKDYRTEEKAFEEQHPIASTAAEIGGAMVAPTMALNLLRTGNIASRTAKGAGVAGAEGALYGFGSGEGGFGERFENGLKTGLFSSVIGGAAPWVSKGAKHVAEALLQGRAAKKMMKNAPTTDMLHAAAKNIFDKADNSSPLNRDVLSKAFPNIYSKAQRQGLDEVLTPLSSRAMNRLEDAATNPSPNIGFRDLDILRRQSNIPANNSKNRVERAIGGGLVDGIDGVIDQAAPNLGKEVADARKMWGQLRRSELVDTAMVKANNQASGYENGLRTQFRQILDNPKKNKGFSKDETEAMQRVVRGTKTSNLLKKVGRLGFGVGQQSNSLTGLFGIGLGGTLGGGPGAVMMPMIGTAAQKLSERATRKQADLAKALVATGGISPKPQLTQEQRLMVEILLNRSARSVEALK